MANLTTQRWERYIPDLGDNRQQPEAQRLELEVASGLTTAQMQGLSESLQKQPEEGQTQLDILAAALSPFVRLRGGPHTINGEKVESLADYFRAIYALGDKFHVHEVTRTLQLANSLTEDDEVFSRRQSGGWVSTQRRAAAKAADSMGAH